MRGTDLDQADLAAADVQLELPGERAGRRYEPHLVEGEGTERLGDVWGDRGDLTPPWIREWHRSGEPESVRERAEALHLGRGLPCHNGCGGVGGDDLDAADLLVSPPVVAVGVRVDDGLDRRLLDQRRHRREHAPRER